MSYFFEETRMKSWEAVLFQAAVDISIPPSLYKTIEKRYGTLEGIINASDNPALKSAHIFPQGSIRLKTAIKPLSDASGELDTVDADAVVWLDDADSATAEDILAAFLDRFEKGSKVEAEIEPLRRGIRVKYADEKPGFHIDITPARNAFGNGQDSGKGALEVPDRDLKDWKASSPIQYSDWLQAISEKELPVLVMENFREGKEVVAKATMELMPEYDEYVDTNVLRALIKLIKRTRDVWAYNHPDDDKFRPISAILTTLAGKAYEKLADQGTQILVNSPFEVMQAVIKTMPEFIDGSEGQWEVLNPVNGQENFAEKWNRPDGMKYRTAFNDWHAHATKAFSLGLEEFTSNSSFQEALNESFFVGSSTVEQTLKQLPKGWNLPGRKLGDTGTKIALGILGGDAVASSNQQSVKQPDRLG